MAHRGQQDLSRRLRDLLNRQATAVGEEALRNGGEVPGDQVESLQQLARLVELSEKAQQGASRNRWLVALAFGSTLLIASLLLFGRLARTEIELDVSLSEVRFDLPVRQVLADSMELSALGVSGLREIRLPAPAGVDARTITAGGGDAAIRFAAPAEGPRRGTISLASIEAPPGTRVWLRHAGIPNQFRLSLTGAGISLRADVHGPVHVAVSGEPQEQVDFVSPRAVALEPGLGVVDLDLTFSDLSRADLSPQISIADLSFFHVDPFGGGERPLVRRLSTVISGTLYLEELHGKERPLRVGESIDFDEARGEIRGLALRPGQVSLRFHGDVRGMVSGFGDSRRSLMPTLLEWLRARHGLSLLWGTAFYLFTLILGALRWLRISV